MSGWVSLGLNPAGLYSNDGVLCAVPADLESDIQAHRVSKEGWLVT